MRNFALLLFTLLCFNLGSAQSIQKDELNGESEVSLKTHFTKKGPVSNISWNGDLESGYYQIELTDLSDNQTNKFETQESTFELSELEYNRNYEFRIIASEGGVSQVTPWMDISTNFTSELHLENEIADIVFDWRGEEIEQTTLASYIKERGAHLDKRILEDFLIRFYKDINYEEKDRNSTECTCSLSIRDEYIQSKDTTYTKGSLDWQDVWCGLWKREVELESKEVLQGSRLALKGRLKKTQSKTWEITDVHGGTNVTVKLICNQTEMCCPADIDYGVSYESNILAHGVYEGKGNYDVKAADVGMLFMVNQEGIIETSNILAHAVNTTESTVDNEEFWDAVQEAIIPTAEAIALLFGVPIDSTIADLPNIIPELEAFVDAVFEVATTSPVIHETSGSNLDNKSFKSTGKFTLNPNEQYLVGLQSSQYLSFTDVWGKKVICNTGSIDVEASVENSFAMAFAYTNDLSEGSGCCFDEYAKWISGSRISAANQTGNQAFVGSVIGCNGEIDGERWKYENGNEIECNFGNPVINDPWEVLTANGCGSLGEQELNYSFTCPGAGSSEIVECVSCQEVTVSLEIPDCNPEYKYEVAIIAYSNNQGTTVWENNNMSCFTTFSLPVDPCKQYKIRFTVKSGDQIEVKEYSFFRTCCREIGKRSSGLGGDIIIYPNPANDILNIETEIASIEGCQVFDTSGRLVKTSLSSNGNTGSINLEGLNSGIYILKLATGEIKRFVKN